MRKIKYKDLPPDLKALVKRMEEDLNSKKNQENPSDSPLQVLTRYPIENPATDNGKKMQGDVAVFRVETATGEYIFSHIENEDKTE